MVAAGGAPDRARAQGATVAFFGLFGAWTHMAARKVFGPNAEYLENPTISRVFEAVAGGSVAVGGLSGGKSPQRGGNQTVDHGIWCGPRCHYAAGLPSARG